MVVLRAQPSGRDQHQDRALVEAARGAFSQRRKTLRNALSSYLRQPPDAVVDAIHAAGLDPKARAETLDVDSFANLGSMLMQAELLRREPPVETGDHS